MTKKRSRTNSNSAKRTRRPTTARDPYRGFSVQTTRFLYYLLKSDADDWISLEHFEDVGVEASNGTRLAEQDKSYTSANPLADRSVAFWKTLRNWVDAAQTGDLPPSRSRYVIYAPRAHPGQFVAPLRDAKSLKDARTVLADIRQKLRNKTKGTWDIADAAQEHVDVVFEAHLDVVAEIITRLTVDTSDGPAEDTLKPLLLAKLVSEDAYDDVVKWAHGWVKQNVDLLIEQKKPVCIQQSVFHHALLGYVRSHDRLDILRSVAHPPSPPEVDAELAIRDYVRQLRIIELEDLDLLEAVNDFLRAAVDRTAWSDRGLITTEALRTFEDELKSSWRRRRKAITIAHKSKCDCEKGQLLYCDCMQHTGQVDYYDAPGHFVRGSWHALADERTIGWHPDYNNRLDAVDPEPT